MTLPEHSPGSTWCECAECGEGFGGATLFDAHRVGEHGTRERRCLSVSEMETRGWTRDAKGLWRDLSRGSRPATAPVLARREGANRLPQRKVAHRDHRALSEAAL